MHSSGRLTLNVGGQLFTTTIATLSSFPNTRLGKLAIHSAADQGHTQETEFFFDRNPEIVNSVLDFYRTGGELHLPKHLCGDTLGRELRFWEIPTEVILECCNKEFESQKNDVKITNEIYNWVSQCYETEEEISRLSKWNMIWLFMEKHTMCMASKIWATVYFSIVFLSVTMFIIQTSMSFREYDSGFVEYVLSSNVTLEAAVGAMNLKEKFLVSTVKPWLTWVTRSFYIFFILEFMVRFFTCPSKRFFVKQARNWLDTFLNVHFILTTLLETVILKGKVVYTDAETKAVYFFYTISVLRILRIFYLAKTFDSMKVLVLSTLASVKVLALLAVLVLSLAAIFGAGAFTAEFFSETFAFDSVPYGMWYAIVTMTTVGYGDYYPVSTSGRIVGTLCALCGVIVMALPISVLATTFSNYHDMMGHVQQRKRRQAFVKENPDFRSAAEEAAAAEALKTTADETLPAPPETRKTPFASGKKRDERERVVMNSDLGDRNVSNGAAGGGASRQNQSSAFSFPESKRKSRKVQNCDAKICDTPLGSVSPRGSETE